MKEMWSYDKQKRFDANGRRWHFVRRDFFGDVGDYENQPFELYFRNEMRTEFGVLRFERRKDNPYRNYIVMIDRIMNKADFRRTLLDPDTESVWKRNWK